jgi:hypothetical protein
MLAIREDQVQVLSRYMSRQFEDRMVIQFRNVPPKHKEGFGAGDLRAAIQTGIKDALAYGVNLEEDVRQYLDCAAIWGLRFDAQPAGARAKEILGRQDLDGSAKMREIRKIGGRA